MPSLTLLRRELLHCVQGILIPAMRAREVNTMLADAIPTVPPALRMTPLAMPYLVEDPGNELGQAGQKWPDLNLNSSPFLYVAFVCEGEAHLRIGISERLARTHGGENGGYILEIPAVTVLFLPAGLAYSSGGQAHWERPDFASAHSRIMWVHFIHDGVLCHICTTQGDKHKSHYSLILRDAQLGDIAAIVIDELQRRRPNHDAVASNLLLSLLLRLERELTHGRPALSDGVNYWRSAPPPLLTPARPRLALEVACEYINLRLHEPLTPAIIARQVGITPVQLNRLFRAGAGASIMGYVQQRRFTVAQSILRDGDLQVQEIARLVGYRHLSHFTHAFKAQAGMSPVEFRRASRQNLINSHDRKI